MEGLGAIPTKSNLQLIHVSACHPRYCNYSRLHMLLFGINRLRSDQVSHCRPKTHCLGAIVQLLCNQNFQPFIIFRVVISRALRVSSAHGKAHRTRQYDHYRGSGSDLSTVETAQSLIVVLAAQIEI